MRYLFLTLLAAASFSAAPEQVDITLSAEPHSGIYLSEDEQSAARARMEAEPWATDIGNGLLRTADQVVNANLVIPKTGGQWSHWYTCKKDGGRLKAESPTRHVCKSCGEVYSGFPYDEVYVTNRHSYWMRGIESLGTAYALDPKPEYAVRLRAILLEYAAFYEDIPLHDNKNRESAKGARLYAQTLDESVTLCSLIFGYSLAYDAPCFTAEDHETIANHLLRPMVATILRYKAGISNWQSWHNAGIGATGFLLGDQAMVDFAINDPKHGFLLQMRNGVLPSGMWHEGAPSYHWYALRAHVYLLEAAARSGVDLYALPVVHSLFDGPTEPLFPDMTYPAINDSSRSSIKGESYFYEVGYRRYEDPNYLALREPRKKAEALLWGKDAPEGSAVPALQLETSNDKEGGLSILRDPTRNAALFFNYNPVKGWHTHAAKLDIILYANGDERIVDPGRLSYGNPLHKEWYTQTLAHNTVVVDEATQQVASGQFRAFEVGEDWSLVAAGLDTAYEGVSMTRTLFMRDGVIVDHVQCVSEDEHIYDLPVHFRGTLKGLDGGSAATLASSGGYQHLKDLRKLENVPAEFSVDTGDGTALQVAFFDGGDVFVAEGRAQPATQFLPVVLRRQVGKTVTFTTVYQLLGKDEARVEVGVKEAEGTTTVGYGDTSVVVDSEGIRVTVGGTVAYDSRG